MKTESILQILVLMFITAMMICIVTVGNKMSEKPKTVDNLPKNTIPPSEEICDNYECKLGKG